MSLFVYGAHPVEIAIKEVPSLVKKIYLREGGRRNEFGTLTEGRNIPLEVISAEELDRRSGGGNHQGVAIELDSFPYRGMSDLIEWTANLEVGTLLILDGVEDPQNFGAILRSAGAMGASGVIIGKNRAVGVTAQVIRASAGVAFKVPVVRVTNISRIIKELADHGWWSVAAVMDAQPLWKMPLRRKIAFVMGGEGSGVRRLVRENCDMAASIPMAAGVESMNVSVATALFLYEAMRQQEG